MVWQGEIRGELPGTMKWWFDNPPPVERIAIRDGRRSFSGTGVFVVY